MGKEQIRILYFTFGKNETEGVFKRRKQNTLLAKGKITLTRIKYSKAHHIYVTGNSEAGHPRGVQSALNREPIDALSGIPPLWHHFLAAVFHAGLPHTSHPGPAFHAGPGSMVVLPSPLSWGPPLLAGWDPYHEAAHWTSPGTTRHWIPCYSYMMSLAILYSSKCYFTFWLLKSFVCCT